MVVVDNDVIAKIVAEGYVVAAIQPELHSFEVHENLSQCLCGFVFCFFFLGHYFLLRTQKSPLRETPRGLLPCCYVYLVNS